MLVNMQEVLADIKTAPAKWRYQYGDGHLYMVHSSAGLGKVGYTKKPKDRVLSVIYEFRKMGFEADSAKVLDFRRYARGLEYESINMLSESFEVAKGREYFKCANASDFYACVQAAIQKRADYDARLRAEYEEYVAKARKRKQTRERPEIVIGRIAEVLLSRQSQEISA